MKIFLIGMLDPHNLVLSLSFGEGIFSGGPQRSTRYEGPAQRGRYLPIMMNDGYYEHGLRDNKKYVLKGSRRLQYRIRDMLGLFKLLSE